MPKGKPEFTFDSYYANRDGKPVLHVETGNLDEDEHGPICRVYLNDEVIYENPPLARREGSRAEEE